MKIPRPPGWETNPRIVQGRHLWHRAHLPCPFCLLEGRYHLRAKIGAHMLYTLLVILLIVVIVVILLGR